MFFGVATVVLMIVLNAICIPLYGINGSALATLLTIMLYNTVKFVFVVKKLKLFPFTQHTVREVDTMKELLLVACVVGVIILTTVLCQGTKS